ncbi:Asp23/Gls24 family envelope stress response protein [Deinococcus cavernae]|uniref:Asp23/Gls24 family envelope stress response protein n=1 Tax=Deinococcus cavernae TaxID=2320857 RepID=A0A418V6Q9_9DEIO|nr:Asp23/Gls24 family envelope stress response protein [Deinococcus cavernae]RJF71756.1 Asp23/Gls24 family envelope stress response protein [Deinococcus cavernae]
MATPANSPEVEISKNVLMDIATTTLEGIEGTEIASAPLKVGEVLRNQQSARKPRALKVTREGNEVTVDVGLNVDYGLNLVKVSQHAQRAVCENIELMTGLKVRSVNVSVQGVCLPKGQAS